MGIHEYATHFGGMVLSWAIILGLFAVIIFVVLSRARSAGNPQDDTSNGSGGRSNDEQA